jgi:protein TonB
VAREMFRDVTDPSIRVGNQQWHTLPLSIFVHIVVIVLLIVVPLMAGDILPTPRSFTASFVAPPSPPSPPSPPAPARSQIAKPIVQENPDAAPLETPREINRESAFVLPESEANASNFSGTVIGAGFVEAAPPPLVAAAPPAPIRTGGKIQAPRKISGDPPGYPPIAQSARVQGVVILEATIGVDGRVEQLRVLRSIPLLDAAAIEAVSHWQYTPTLLNGVAVPVIMTVTVNFSLR